MKRQIIAKINNIANELDRNGLYAEATTLTNIMKKLAFDPTSPEHSEIFGPHNDDPEEGKIIVSYTEDPDNSYQSTNFQRLLLLMLLLFSSHSSQ